MGHERSVDGEKEMQPSLAEVKLDLVSEFHASESHFLPLLDACSTIFSRAPLTKGTSHTTNNFFPIAYHLAKMPISKKDRVRKEQKKADAAGTRAPVLANGTPVKAAKPKSICAYCRKELVRLD